MALARTAAIALLLAGPFALLRGLDWRRLSSSAVIAGLLALYRDAFYRGGVWRRDPADARLLGAGAATLVR
jgi:lysylphosphatidylglycerol synthetase-like protein (DUF2156 family)